MTIDMDLLKRPLESVAHLSDGRHASTAFEKLGLQETVHSLSDSQADPSGTLHNIGVSDPRPLEPDTKAAMFNLAYDVFLMAIPVFLLTKAILCVVAYNIDLWVRNVDISTVSNLTIFLVNFNTQLSTAFTIAFITIISTMVRRWALYKAQYGARLAELEQLQASISLPSTAKMIYSLRRFGVLSGALLFIWSFYYLGSQACAREYKLVNSKPFHTARLAMLLPNTPSVLTNTSTPVKELSQHYLDCAQALITHYQYQTGVSVNSNSGNPYDMFGHTRIPLVEYANPKNASKFNKFINDIDPKLQQGSWIHVNASDQAYTAFDGPLLWQNYSQNEFSPYGYGDGLEYDALQQYVGKLSFTTSYTYVDCTAPTNHSISAFPNGTASDTNLSINFTRNDRGYDSSRTPTIPKQFELWGRWNDTREIDGDSPASVVQAVGSFVATCNLTTSYVEVEADCQPQGCTAKKVRFNTSYPTYDPVTPFDNDTFADTFFDRMLSSMGPQSVEYAAGETYSSGILNAIELDYFTGDYSINDTDIDTLKSDLHDYVVINLIQVINTYYRNSLFTGCSYDNGQRQENCIYFTGKGAVYDPQYLLSIPWIIMDFISCFILLAAAVFSYWLRTRTLAPDIFGYVSSLTRENPHFDLQTDTGSALSGLDRTRALADVKIKIGGYTQENGLPRVIVSHVCEGYEANALHGDAKYA